MSQYERTIDGKKLGDIIKESVGEWPDGLDPEEMDRNVLTRTTGPTPMEHRRRQPSDAHLGKVAP